MAKSKPIGVRFDLEKLELIQKEQKLKLQEIADKAEVSLSTVKRIKRQQNVS